MKCLKSKRFFLLLVVFFFSLSAISLQAEVCSENWDHALREAEDEILGTIFDQQQTIMSEQETKIVELEKSQVVSDQIINRQSILLKEAEIYYRKERIELVVIAGSAGIGIGVLILIILEAIFDPPVMSF